MQFRDNWLVVLMVFLMHTIITVFIVYRTSLLFPEFAEIGFPTSFEQAKALSIILAQKLTTNYVDLLIFEIAGFLYLQAWSIPGTFFFNLMGGGIFGMPVGYPVCVACNTLGALMSFSLSKFFLGKVVNSKFSSQLTFVRKKVQLSNSHDSKVEEHRKDLLYYMMTTRAFPASPSWLLNLTYPHVGVSALYLILSVAVGLAPWNFFACKAGVYINRFNSKAEILDAETYTFLIAFALMFLLVPLGRKIKNKYFTKEEKVKNQ